MTVAYCCESCQAQDWPLHEAVCGEIASMGLACAAPFDALSTDKKAGGLPSTQIHNSMSQAMIRKHLREGTIGDRAGHEHRLTAAQRGALGAALNKPKGRHHRGHHKK